MSKLVPEVRIDKNGNAVTRHVNPDKKKKSLGTVPMPALPAHMLTPEHANNVSAAIQEISNYQQDTLGEGFSQEEKLEHVKAFMYLPDDVLDEITKIGSQAEFLEEPAFRYDCIRLLVNGKAKEDQYRHLLLLADFLADNEDVAENGPERAVSLVLSMTEYDDILDQVRGERADHSNYYVPLCEATMDIEDSLLDGSGFGSKYVDEDGEMNYDNPDIPIIYKDILPGSGAFESPVFVAPKLVQFLIENIDRKDEIISLIRERYEMDPVVLERYLNASHRSLTDGSL